MSDTLSKKYLSLAMAFVTAIVVVGCDKSSNQQSANPTASAPTTTAATSAASAPQPQGQNYTVAMDATYPPYEFKGEKGEVVGFEADLLKAIAQKQGFNVQLLPKPWEGMEDGLASGQQDLIMSAMTRDAQRATKYELSDTYAYGQDAIMTKAEVTDINTFEDLKNRKTATQIDTGSADELITLQGKNSPNTILEKTNFLAFQDVVQGKAEAVLADGGVLRYYAKSVPNVKVRFSSQGDYFKPYEMVLMAKKGNREPIEKFNAGLKQVVADGTYAKLYTQWFGQAPTAEQMPGQTSTASSATATASVSQ